MYLQVPDMGDASVGRYNTPKVLRLCSIHMCFAKALSIILACVKSWGGSSDGRVRVHYSRQLSRGSVGLGNSGDLQRNDGTITLTGR